MARCFRIGLALAAFSTAGGCVAPRPAALQTGEYVVAQLLPGPAWDARLPRDAQPNIGEHRAYLKSQHAAGRFLCGGPWIDEPGALALFPGGSIEGARKLLEADPAVRGGLYRYELRRWRVVAGTAR